VGRSSSHRDDVVGEDLHGAFSVDVVSRAQLAVTVFSHGPKRAITFDEQAVVASSSYRHHVGGDDLGGYVAVDFIPRAQLAVIVEAHAPEAAVCLDEERVLGDVAECGHGKQ
jgi:hypothetical protein